MGVAPVRLGGTLSGLFLWRRTTRGSRRDRGAAAVEFALVILPIVTMIFGALEFGLALQARTVIGNSAREGVRIASLGASEQEIRDAVTNSSTVINGTKTVTLVCKNAAGGNCTFGKPENSGGTATVTVSVQYQGVTGMFPSLTDSTITRSSTMRIE